MCYNAFMEEKQIFITAETDIYFNLATEKYLIEEYDPESTVLYLWKNKPVVVIGRYQNPWDECNLEQMKKDGVALARRYSGGGAVYQDLGNICFTFISPVKKADKSKNFELVLKALEMMGIQAQLSGRNDILVEGKKVSGSAFQTTHGRFCHHGTMLVSTDLTKLPLYLTPDLQKLESHGVKSVSSRVANLSDFSPLATTDLFAFCLSKVFNEQCPINIINMEKIELYPSIKQSFENFSSKEWTFDKCPTFTDKITGKLTKNSVSSMITFYLTVKKGVITEASVASDSLFNNGFELLEKEIIGLPYEAFAISKKADEIKNAHSFVCDCLHLLAKLIKEERPQ